MVMPEWWGIVGHKTEHCSELPNLKGQTVFR